MTKTPLFAPVAHVAAVSSTAHLDPVFLTTGIVIKKEIVLMALMNLPLVCTLRQHAKMMSSSVTMGSASSKNGSVIVIMTVGT